VRSRILLLSVMLVVVFGVTGYAADPVASEITVDGVSRTFLIYTPPGLDKNITTPLLFVLHGSAGNGEVMMTVTQRGFERIADKEKFIVIYPDALERRWNAQDGTVDDGGFLLAIVDKLAAEFRVNKKRVYMAGISNGGMMAQRMACEHSDRVAAIATVAGTMPAGMTTVCKPSRPVPVMVIHGTKDPIVPWGGGAVAGFAEFGQVVSAAETFRFWASHDLCKGEPLVVNEPDRDPQDGTRVRLERLSDCSNKAEVTLVAVEGGGHTWPGGYQYLPEPFIGKTSKDIDANTLIWNFFKGYANP